MTTPYVATTVPAPAASTPTPSPTGEVLVAAARDVGDILLLVLAALAAVGLAYVAAAVIGAVARRAARRSVLAAELSRRSRRPLRAVLVVVAVWAAVRLSTSADEGWRPALEHVLLIALIATLTWLVGSLAFVLEDLALARYRVDVKDNRHARRMRTQVQVLRRLTVAVLVLVAVSAVLLTFPGARALGASLFASAGLLSIVAGLAAQSSLANMFAGMQLAFTDAIRVDDVVVVEGEWGRIEEITLTYVVVHVWDDRRLILPSTYFTTTPFQNWTRRAAELLGTVEIDVDWRVPVDAMRAELARLLAATDLWDERVGILQVTDAVGGVVRVRALASAVDAPTLFDLRCHVREGLVAWLQREAPEGLPRTRLEHDGRRVELPADQTVQRPADRLFTGSTDAVARSQAFSGPGREVIDEREHSAHRQDDPDRLDDPEQADDPGRVDRPERADGAAGRDVPSAQQADGRGEDDPIRGRGE